MTAPSYSALPKQLVPENIFRSFIRPLYLELDRTLFPSPGYVVMYGENPEERLRNELEVCEGFFQALAVVFSGGRGNLPHIFHVVVGVKQDSNPYYTKTFAAMVEVIRLYEQPLPLYDYFSNRQSPAQVDDKLLAPVYEQTVVEDNSDEYPGFDIIRLQFQVFSDRELAKFDVSL